MFKYIFSILYSENPHIFILQSLVFVALVALAYHLFTNKQNRILAETMQSIDADADFDAEFQAEPYLLKTDAAVYDDFYVALYDPLTSVVPRTDWEIENVLKVVKPDKAFATILDVGAGSGYKVAKLRKMGFRAYGVDKSASMVQRSDNLFDNTGIKQGDVLEPMLYETATFTHIFCSYFTIYEIQNKQEFFNNCRRWTAPNGYLILHLVDPLKFNAFVTLDKENPPQSKDGDRVVVSNLDLQDLEYYEKYDFPANPKHSEVLYTQKITEKSTKKVRHNEQTLYMNSVKEVLKMATRVGFVVHGQINMAPYNDDKHQYLFVLERTM